MNSKGLKSISVRNGYEVPAWWYDVRGFIIFKISKIIFFELRSKKTEILKIIKKKKL